MFSITSTFNLNAGCPQDSLSMEIIPSRLRRSVSPTMLANLSHYGYRNRSYEPSLDLEDKTSEDCHSLYFLLDFFHQYYIPSIILLGLVGNLLSCIVFLNTHLRIRSSSYYLAALATADFGFLVTLLLVWLNNTLGWKVFNKDGWCETLVYVSAVCSSLSVWLIVAFTVERFIAVQYPLHRPHICTIARAKAIVLVLVILALGSHSYSFVTAGVVLNRDGEEYCDLKPEYLETMKIISIIDSIASLIAPLVLIIVMNTMIMRNLLRFSRRFKQTSTASTDCPSREQSDINLNQIPRLVEPYSRAPQYATSRAPLWRRRRRSLQKSRREFDFASNLTGSMEAYRFALNYNVSKAKRKISAWSASERRKPINWNIAECNRIAVS